MDIKVINYDATKGDLSIKLVFGGVFIGTYSYQLWDPTATSLVETKIGHNFNASEDTVALPSPASINDGRYVRISTEIKPQNVGDDYSITLQVVQAGKVLGEVNDSGTMSTPALTSIIWTRLKAN